MKNLIITFLVVLFVACTNNGKDKKVNTPENNISLSSSDTIEKKPIIPYAEIKQSTSNIYQVVDTIDGNIKTHFDFNGLSNEGGEGVAFYNKLNKKIVKSVITLYGERGRTEIEYRFKGEKIEVIESEYRYLVPIGEIKSNEEIKLDTTFSYTLNLKEKLNTNNIFNEFKAVVPFEIH